MSCVSPYTSFVLQLLLGCFTTGQSTVKASVVKYFLTFVLKYFNSFSTGFQLQTNEENENV